MLLQHLYIGLDKETACYLDNVSHGAFLHLTVHGGWEVLNKVFENTPYTGVHDEFPRKEKFLGEKPPIPIDDEPSVSQPEPTLDCQEEGESPSDLFDIEDDLFEDYENARHFPIHAIQYIDQSPNPPKETSCQKSFQELSAILSHEWTVEAEATDDIFCTDYHVTAVKCQIRGRHILALYDLVVGLNMISSSYLARNFPNTHRFQINQCLRDPYGNILESKGIVKLISVSLEGVEALLDLYVFNVTYFNVLLGQP